jgi:hypothetical protein
MAARSGDGIATMILRDAIDPHMQRAIILALMIRGFDTEVSRLEAPHAFLEHLVLHEAAHLLLADGASESECDRWAFDRLSGQMHEDTGGVTP